MNLLGFLVVNPSKFTSFVRVRSGDFTRSVPNFVACFEVGVLFEDAPVSTGRVQKSDGVIFVYDRVGPLGVAC